MRIPLAVPNLNGREAEYLQECVDSTFVSTAGPFVQRFSDGIAAVSGTGSAVVTCTGTVAIQMALEAFGIGAGDITIIPSLTFIATANAVRHTGAATWLMDSGSDWTIDLDLVRTQLEEGTEPADVGRRHRATGGAVRAIVPVLTMGASVDFEAVVELAREFDLKVVLDAAAAIGATDSSGRPLGRTGVDAVCYSFNGNKTITSGGGGAIASADPNVVECIDHLISTGRVGRDYEHDVVGYNFRMTNLEAAVGLAQLEQLPTFLDRKRQIACRYAEHAANFVAVDPFPEPASGQSVYWFSGLAYVGEDSDVPEQFRQHMNHAGIDVRPFWKPVHLQQPYRESLATEMPVAESVWQRIIPLPCSTGLTDAELDDVIRASDAFWSAHSN